MKIPNTLQKGSVRYMVFQEDNAWYAVGFEFNIVEEGSTPEEAMLLLFEAIKGYVESARKIKARPNILNQKTDSEYETMWNGLRDQKKDKNIFAFGELNLGKRFAVAA